PPRKSHRADAVSRMSRWESPLMGLSAIAVLAACAGASASAPAAEPIHSGRDYHTLANVDAFHVRHLALHLDVDFAARRLRGTAELRVERIAGNERALVLDTRALDIASVQWLAADAAARPLKFDVGAAQATLGAPLRIALPRRLPRVFSIRIHYATRPEA